MLIEAFSSESASHLFRHVGTRVSPGRDFCDDGDEVKAPSSDVQDLRCEV